MSRNPRSRAAASTAWAIGGVERVGDVLDHEAERRGGAALAQRAREVVALEAELGDRLGDALGGRGRHPGLRVDHARDRLQAHARLSRHVSHRGSRDNVVIMRDASGCRDLCQGRAMTEFETILYAVDGPVAKITLNRPSSSTRSRRR